MRPAKCPRKYEAVSDGNRNDADDYENDDDGGNHARRCQP